MSVRKYTKILLGTSLIILGIIITLFGIAELIEYRTGNNFLRNYLSVNRSGYVRLKSIIYIITGIFIILNGIFKRKKKEIYEDFIDYETEELPNFIYHRDPLKSKAIVLNTEGGRCNCCNTLSKYIYTGPFYGNDNIICLCPECIISGKAHSKLGVYFHNPADLKDIANASAVNEVSYRTPGYTSWQEEKWLACCDDLCVFHGCLTWIEITKMGILDEIKTALEENEDYHKMGLSLDELSDSINKGVIDMCVFECMHCGKYKVDLNLC